MSKELEIKLEKPVECFFNDNGVNEIRVIDTFYFTAPTYKHKDLMLEIRQAFFGACTMLAKQSSGNSNANSSEKDKADDFEVNEEMVKGAINFSGDGFDIVKFYNNMTKLFVKDICFKDEEKKNKILSSELGKLSAEDMDKIVIDYIVCFFATSWSRLLK